MFYNEGASRVLRRAGEVSQSRHRVLDRHTVKYFVSCVGFWTGGGGIDGWQSIPRRQHKQETSFRIITKNGLYISNAGRM